jgi:hypothetical protein
VTTAALAALYATQERDSTKYFTPHEMSSDDGPVRLSMANLTEGTLRFVVSGAGVGRIFDLEPCRSCPAFPDDYFPDEYECDHPGPRVTVTVPPGTYRVYAELKDGDGGFDAYGETWKLSGGIYSECFYYTE